MTQGQPGAHTTGRAHPANVTPAGGPVRGRAPLVPMRSANAPQASGVRAANRERRLDRIATFGRYGVWTIPIFAVFVGLLPRASGAFSTDPATYERYLATEHRTISDLLRTMGVNLFGVLSMAALAALLFKARGRGLALAGLVAGLAGATLLVLEVGSLVIRNESMREALLGGHVTRITGNAHATSRLVPAGVGLLVLAWILLGVAVFVAKGLSRTDGVLLVISAPMIFAGGMVLDMIPVLGAFLLLAAGLGIGFAAGKVVQAGTVTPPPVRLERPQSAFARFVDTPEDAATIPAAITQVAPTRGHDIAGAQPRTAGPAPDDKPRKPWSRLGVSTSWSVTRSRSDDLDDIVAPPPATPPSAKNFKPIATTKRNGSVLNGASVKTTGLNAKPLASGQPGSAAADPTHPTDRAAARRADNERRDAENARSDKAKNRSNATGGGAKGEGKPEGPKGPATGRD